MICQVGFHAPNNIQIITYFGHNNLQLAMLPIFEVSVGMF